MEPVHLEKVGDAAFVSLMFNCLPWQGSGPPTRNQRLFCEHVKASLSHIPEHGLDLERTDFFFEQEALDEIRKHSGDSNLDGKISTKSPFLKGCFRIVRGA